MTRSAPQKAALHDMALGSERLPLDERAVAWKSDFDEVPSHVWQRNGATVTVSDFAASGNKVHFLVTVTDGKGNVIHENDHCIINPPTMHPDGGTDESGKPTFAPNVGAIVRKIVEDHLP